MLSSIAYGLAAVSGVVCLLGVTKVSLIVAVTQYPLPAAFFLVAIIGILMVVCATTVARALQWFLLVQFFGWVGLIVLGVGIVGIHKNYRDLEIEENCDDIYLFEARHDFDGEREDGIPLLSPIKVIEHACVTILCRTTSNEFVERFTGRDLLIYEDGRVIAYAAAARKKKEEEARKKREEEEKKKGERESET